MAPRVIDRCSKCGEAFEGSYWMCGNGAHARHTACVDWDQREAPYQHLLKKLRKMWRGPLDDARRQQVLEAGLALREMVNQWPRNAVSRVERVHRLVKALGL